VLHSISSYFRIMLAKHGVTYSHASTQVDLGQDIATEVLDWSNTNIPDDILHNDEENSMGREDEIHVTLLYGIDVDDPSEVQKLIPPEINMINIRLGLITAFLDNPDYDVLKIDVESPEMMKLHYMLGEKIPNSNSFPTYTPHLTLAYLNKGEAMKFIGDDNFRYRTYSTPMITFSHADGHKSEIYL
jgi:hypothetical protein